MTRWGKRSKVKIVEEMLMAAEARFLIVLSVMLFTLVLKWFIPHFIAPEQMRRICRRWIGIDPEIPRFGRLFRLLGWDIANAALGLMVLACILEDSKFRHICNQVGDYDLIFAIGCFIIYIILYGIAILMRYIFLEAAERVGIRRVWSGLVLWLMGLAMLLNSSWFVAGGQ